MNLGRMRTLVKTRSGSSDTALIGELINIGYLSFAEAADIPYEATVSTDPNYHFYSMTGDLISFRDVLIKNDNGSYTKLAKAYEEDYDRFTTGKPTHYFKKGRNIGFIPKADKVYEVLVLGIQYPNKLVAETDSPVIDIPERFHLALVENAVDYIKSDDDADQDDLDVSSFFTARFERTKQEFRKFKKGEDSSPTMIKDVYGGL